MKHKHHLGLSEDDHARVSAAVSAAEVHTDGEIVTIIADHSDDYRESSWRVAIVAALIGFGLMQFTGVSTWLVDDFTGGWGESAAHSKTDIMISLFTGLAVFLALFLLCRSLAFRIALTPNSVKIARVHDAAIRAFRIGAQGRTAAHTGILIYLSEQEQRAEIVGDETINARIDSSEWGEAMDVMLAEVKAGRAADGIAAAVANAGVILAKHLPKSEGNPNELSDRLIEL